MKIPLGRPYIKKDIVLKEIERVLDRRWLSGGPAISEFEDAVKTYNKDEEGHYIAVANATVGLELALRSVCYKNNLEGAEVIVPSWSWVASGFAVKNVGATPVWVDVNGYGVPDPGHIVRSITHKTKAIIVVHQMGVPCDLDALHKALYFKFGSNLNAIPIIEDAACAFGSEYRGKKIGNSGNTIVYSFQARKCLTTGEGGMIVTRDKDQANWYRSMRAFGTTVSPLQRDTANYLMKEHFDKIGTNYKISDLQCALGLAHLQYFDEEIQKRETAGLYYNRLVEDLRHEGANIQIGNLIPNYCTKYNWQNYHVVLGDCYDRDMVVDQLRKRDIGCKWDIQAIHLEPAISEGRTILPFTENFHNHGLWLPFFAEITKEEQDHVISNLKEVLNKSIRWT
jgi:dTDP-4-amino-4,6-dideoxygalactose transaminase